MEVLNIKGKKFPLFPLFVPGQISMNYKIPLYVVEGYTKIFSQSLLLKYTKFGDKNI